MTGKNLHLRTLEPTDIDLLYGWENDRQIWPVSNTVTPFSRFILEQYILNSHQDIYTTKQLRLMIELSANNQTIGAVDLFDFDPGHQRVGLGILINKENRGKGYSKEALNLVIDYCFNTLMVHQIFCNIGSDNEISMKLFQSLGFEIVGNKRDWLHINNQWKDEYLLQLIKKEIK
jgi:diamine N-acetyltransferase